MALPSAAVCRRLRCVSSFSIGRRDISTTAAISSRKVFKSFPWFNRDSTDFHERQKTDPNPKIPPPKFGREPGYRNSKNELVVIPEMVPELVVPDLTDCNLKPYVSYRAPEVNEPPFTARDLFDYVYADKIEKDFKEGRLDGEGNPLEPSEDELLTPEVATLRAKQTGTDIFTDHIPVNPPGTKRDEEIPLPVLQQ